jgi:hypothetical protein
VCTDHGDYEVTITPDSLAYLDLATLYRNLIKEGVAARDGVTLSVIRRIYGPEKEALGVLAIEIERVRPPLPLPL